MRSLIVRNMKVYFRDRASIFFSLMAVLIIFALYLLFLGDVWTSELPKVEGARTLMDQWIMAGLLAVTSMTTVLGAFGTMVDDRAQRIVKDFKATPTSRGRLVAGYELASFLIGSVMSLLAQALSQVYIVSRGGALLGVGPMLEVVGLILFSALCNTAFLALIVGFIKTQNAFGTVSSILGTLVGFLTGIYLPIGMLPAGVQLCIKIFPLSHAALLIRRVMMENSLTRVFAGAPASVTQAFEEQMGVIFRFGDVTLSTGASIAILAGCTAVFYLLSLWRFSKTED